jgi:hypothetical protein
MLAGSADFKVGPRLVQRLRNGCRRDSWQKDRMDSLSLLFFVVSGKSRQSTRSRNDLVVCVELPLSQLATQLTANT